MAEQLNTTRPYPAMFQLVARVERRMLAVIEWAEQSVARAAILIGLISMITLLPGLASLPPTDRDEARFAQSSRQMVETGDIIDIRFQSQPRWKKPAGIYWLQAMSAWVFGGADAPIWAYRLPSSLAAFLGALLTVWAMIPLLGRRAALVAGLLVSLSVIVVVEGHIAKTDAALMALTVTAQGALARLWGNRVDGLDWRHLVFWGALAGGILIKGPIIFLAVGGTLVWLCVSERSVAQLGKLQIIRGLILLAAVTLPWYLAIGLRSSGGFFAEAVGKDLLAKVAQGAEKHWGPPGYYIGIIWGIFWPWASLLVLAVPHIWRWRNAFETRFLLGWAVPFWVVFAMVSTKLPHYVLPIIPALAGGLALWLIAPDKAIPSQRLRWIASGLFGLVGMVLCVLVIAGLPLIEGTASLVAIPMAIVALVAVAIGARALSEMRLTAFLGSATLAALLIYPAVFGYSLPRLEAPFVSPRLAAAYEPWKTCTNRPLSSVHYHEPSLVFAGGTDTALMTRQEAVLRLRDEDGWLIFYEPRGHLTLEDFAKEVGHDLRIVSVVRGFNYNRGDWISLPLLSRVGDPVVAACSTG